MKFEDYYLIEQLKKSIAKQGYKRPTDIQFKSIPPILNGEDVLAIAQTGTGKTAAFAIPIIHTLHSRKLIRRPDGIKCLVMAPTHELALQIENVFKVNDDDLANSLQSVMEEEGNNGWLPDEIERQLIRNAVIVVYDLLKKSKMNH